MPAMGVGVAAAVSASQSEFSVAATLTIRNYTKWTLIPDGCYPYYGQIKTPPRTVLPGYDEIMQMHKTGYQTSGTSGTVAWELQGSPHPEIPLVVMWSVPYDQNLHSNWLGIGQFNCGHGTDSFYSMYYSDRNDYTKKDFYSNVSPLEYHGYDTIIIGSMGSSHKTDIIVEVTPIHPEEMAE